MNEKLIIYVDGASRGNPGRAAIGGVITDAKGKQIDWISQRIDDTTNNQAEYQALIAALKKAKSLKAKEVLVNSDSELMVKQILGLYRVKNEGLKPLYNEAKKLADSFEFFKIRAVPREINREADRLANEAFKLQK
jgi:ribonuclease HI